MYFKSSCYNKYKWGHIECGKITSHDILNTEKIICHDIVHTNAIGPLNPLSPKIEFYASLLPHPSAVSKNLGGPSANEYWGSCYFGKIMCNDIIHVNAIGSYGTTPPDKIEFYNSLLPHPSGQTSKTIGSLSQPWTSLFTNSTFTNQLNKYSSTHPGIICLTNLVPNNNPSETYNLGSSTLKWDNLYVKNLYADNMTGGANNMKCGTGNTNISTGEIYVPLNFPAGTTPRVVATVKNSDDPIIISVKNVTNAGFTVKTIVTTTAQHRHKIGTAASTLSSNADRVNPLAAHTHPITLSHNMTPTTSVRHDHYSVTGYTTNITGYENYRSPVNGAAAGFHAHEFARTGFGSNSDPSGNTGGPNQAIAPYMRQLWLRQQLPNGSIDAFSAGGTLTTVESGPIDLCTEDYVPSAGQGFVACGAAFDWIAMIT